MSFRYIINLELNCFLLDFFIFFIVIFGNYRLPWKYLVCPGHPLPLFLWLGGCTLCRYLETNKRARELIYLFGNVNEKVEFSLCLDGLLEMGRGEPFCIAGTGPAACFSHELGQKQFDGATD